jgi:hypothetical protein
MNPVVSESVPFTHNFMVGNMRPSARIAIGACLAVDRRPSGTPSRIPARTLNWPEELVFGRGLNRRRSGPYPERNPTKDIRALSWFNWDCPEIGGIMINTIRPVGYVAGWGFADGMDAAIGWNGGHADPVRPSTAGRFRAAICYPKMAKNEPRRPEPTATTSAPPTAVLWDKLHASLEGDYD